MKVKKDDKLAASFNSTVSPRKYGSWWKSTPALFRQGTAAQRGTLAEETAELQPGRKHAAAQLEDLLRSKIQVIKKEMERLKRILEDKPQKPDIN